MIELDEIRAKLACESLVRGIDQLPKGHVRIETALRYPDGGSIEVFVINSEDEPLLSPKILSDLGQTTSWLLDVQVKPWLSRKRQALVDDVLHIYKVRQNGGALEVDVASLDELESKVIVLAQACLRVADLTFTRRASLQVSFSEDLEEIIVDSDLVYEPDAELLGRFDTPVRVDYLVHGKNRDSAMMGWSSGNTSQAHAMANEIFRRWYDLDVPSQKAHRVTVFDDRYDVYRQDDMKRIRDYSDLLALSDRITLSDALAA